MAILERKDYAVHTVRNIIMRTVHCTGRDCPPEQKEENNNNNLPDYYGIRLRKGGIHTVSGGLCTTLNVGYCRQKIVRSRGRQYVDT